MERSACCYWERVLQGNDGLGSRCAQKRASSAEISVACPRNHLHICLFFQPLDLASWGDHCLRRQKIHPVSIRGNPGVYIHALTDIGPAEGALLMTESSPVSKRRIATLCTGPRPGIGKIPGGSDASRRVVCTR